MLLEESNSYSGGEHIIVICKTENCTGCGLCAAVCPKQCITLVPNEYGSLKYTVNGNKCISCGKCIRSCHIVNDVETNKSFNCFAAYSLNKEDFETSSSGGVAAQLYETILNSGGVIVGACFENEKFVLKFSNNREDIAKFKGSKYVWCETNNIYREVQAAISSEKTVCFIGTPCQVAAIKQYIGDTPLLLTVDLICHGTPPQKVLFEHIEEFCRKDGNKDVHIKSISFRDDGIWRLNTTLENGFSKKSYGGTDEYFMAFLRGISYNNNCYNCKYANINRVSDLTIGDFWGLDPNVLKSEGIERASLVLVNTKHGSETLHRTANLKLIPRELEEALPNNAQLTKPSQKSSNRYRYEKYYPVRGFDKTIHALDIEKERRKNKIIFACSSVKNFLYGMLRRIK
ncbi:MAG: Coenzyme F420 hydrogenase/dehydrogenase, beta subunit C-terminal domain [Acidaminococcaceae bacterium]